MNRAKQVYERSLKAKELDPLKIENLTKKYQRMELAMKTQTDIRQKKWKDKRREWLNQLKRVEEAREESRRREQERIREMKEKLEQKEMNATNTKLIIYKEITKKKAEHNKKQKEVQQLLNILKLEELEEREKLKKKYEEDLYKTNEIRQYKEYIKNIRTETALRFKYIKKNRDYTNPYLAAEIKASQIASENKSKPSSNIEEEASKTTNVFYLYL